MFNRHPTAQWLDIQDSHILVDCGEATQMQLLRYGLKSGRLQHIFISHLHGDHYLGLVGLLSSLNLNGRKDEVYLYGPQGLDSLLDHHFNLSETTLNFPLHYTSTTGRPPGIILNTPHFTVESFELYHSIPCMGFKFSEKPKSRRIIKEKIKLYDVPDLDMPSIKQGADYTTPEGLVIPNSELTADVQPSKSYAFCSDTRYEPGLTRVLAGVSTLYHESTFLSDMAARAQITYHSTAYQAADIALASGVEKLLLGHFSARYRDLNPLLEEAKHVFPNSFLALEGLTFSI